LIKALVLSLAVIAAALAAPAAGARAQAEPLPGAAAGTPDGVVRELYRVHNDGRGPLFEKRGRKWHEKFFDRKLADLIWKDLTETPEGEVGHIDFDPLYNAQDTQIKNFRVGAPDVRGDEATVPVTFTNYAQKVKIDFRLVRTKDGWRISNIVYPDGDFLKILSAPMSES
jgi:hypothetical protein